MDTVSEAIEAAREALGHGRDRRAADLLTSAAVEARPRAGWLARRRWDDVIRISQQRQSLQPVE